MSRAISNRRKNNREPWEYLNRNQQILGRIEKKRARLAAMEQETEIINKIVSSTKKHGRQKFVKRSLKVLFVLFLLYLLFTFFGCGNQRPQVIYLPGTKDTVRLEFTRQAECPDGTVVECPCDTNLVTETPGETLIVPANNSQWRQQERTDRRQAKEETKQDKQEEKTERQKSKDTRKANKYKAATEKKLAQITANIAKKSDNCNARILKAVIWAFLLAFPMGMATMFQLSKRFSLFRKFLK